MTRRLTRHIYSIFALLAFSGCSATALANPQTATIPGARANMDVLPARSFQGEAFSYKHQVTVALPAQLRGTTRPPVSGALGAGLALDDAVCCRAARRNGARQHGARDDRGRCRQSPRRGIGGCRQTCDRLFPARDGYAPPGLAGERWSALAPIPDFPHQAMHF